MAIVQIPSTMRRLGDSSTLAETLKARREKLSQLINFPIALWSGRSNARNFPANIYPFRASSHFLYFTGLPLENAAIRLKQGKLTLFMDDASPASGLWHGEVPSRTAIAQQIGADADYPLAELTLRVQDCATVRVQDPATRLEQAQVLNRAIASESKAIDLALVKAISTVRMTHDGAAIAELRQAAAVSIQAHQAGMAATRTAKADGCIADEC